jgi:uncharacterized protein YlxP (DUF503 family)
LTIGVYTFEVFLPGARSLKDKRQVLRRLKDRLRSRHNVAVAETGDHADLWQRAGLTVVSVASSRDALERLFEAVYREAECVPGQILELGTEYFEAADGDATALGEEA